MFLRIRILTPLKNQQPTNIQNNLKNLLTFCTDQLPCNQRALVSESTPTQYTEQQDQYLRK
jgi:hypothetical protein